jgi:hypothetical protein
LDPFSLEVIDELRQRRLVLELQPHLRRAGPVLWFKDLKSSFFEKSTCQGHFGGPTPESGLGTWFLGSRLLENY